MADGTSTRHPWQPAGLHDFGEDPFRVVQGHIVWSALPTHRLSLESVEELKSIFLREGAIRLFLALGDAELALSDPGNLNANTSALRPQAAQSPNNGADL